MLYHRQEIIESIIYGVIRDSLTNEVDCQTSNGMHSLQLQVVNRNSERSKMMVVGTKACNHIVSRGQTLFCTEGKGLGHDHRVVCLPGIQVVM